MNTLPDSLFTSAQPRATASSAGLPPRRSICTRRACVPQLIRETAEAALDAVALSCGGAPLTYGQLDARSDELGGHLRELGVGPEVVVGLNLDRSADYVIAALAVWKAGGAYLPLDPLWSAAQRTRILEDAAAPVLIARSGDGVNARIVVDLDRAHIRGSALFPHADTRREQLALVIYTAPPGGEPRGVELTHGNLLSLIFWHRRAFEVGSTDVASFLSGPAYDTAAWELWPYLTAGARVVVADDEASSPERLRSWLLRERISMAYVPSELAGPVLAPPSSEPTWPEHTALRHVFTGNGNIRVKRALPFPVHRHWGPAECTVVSTSIAVNAGGLGNAIAHTQVGILDEHGKAGERGEICISGPGVARGYRRRPQLTRDHFSILPGGTALDHPQRVFRTGEWGRKLPGGAIEFAPRSAVVRDADANPPEAAPLLWADAGWGPGSGFAALAKHLRPRTLRRVAMDPLEVAGLPADPSLEEIAAGLVRAIRTAQAEGPYRLGGWREQAILAYEAAVQLRKAGDEVELLVMFEPPDIGQRPSVAERLRSALAGRQTASRQTEVVYEHKLREAVRRYDPPPNYAKTLVLRSGDASPLWLAEFMTDVEFKTVGVQSPVTVAAAIGECFAAVDASRRKTVRQS